MSMLDFKMKEMKNYSLRQEVGPQASESLSSIHTKMKVSNRSSYRTHIIKLVFGILTISFLGCGKETTLTTNPVVDNYIYDVNGEIVYQTSLQKNKQKTPEQYISILYANLFQTSIPVDVLGVLGEVRVAIGDKQMANELILNGFVHDPDVLIVSNGDMRDNVNDFIDETYLRFFLRAPTAYEKFELKKMIEEDLDLTPELIYQGFALSNEYQFY